MARLYNFEEASEIAEEYSLLVSSTIMRDKCDVRWLERVSIPPKSLFSLVPRGTTVHINAKHLKCFIENVLPNLCAPIVLISGGETVNTDVPGYKKIIESPFILHWFLQNYALDPKYEQEGRVTKLPLGLNYHKLETFPGDNTSLEMGFRSRHGNQQLTLKAIRDTMPDNYVKPLKIYANFHLSMDTFMRSKESHKRARARRECLRELRGNKLVVFESSHLPRNEVWRRHKDYAFEASPRGNGLDCHRTWEAILLKTIPIVKSSSLDSMYEGLPVAIVNNWSEITETRLKQWRHEFKDAFESIDPKLTSRHWVEKFNRYK